MANDYYIPEEGSAWQQKQLEEEEEMWNQLEDWLNQKAIYDMKAEADYQTMKDDEATGDR